MSLTEQLLTDLVSQFREVRLQLDRIETNQKVAVVKDGYSVEEAGLRLGKSAYTVRSWCNTGCIRAHKVRGKGGRGEWRITDEEIRRVTLEGPSAEGAFNNPTEFSRRKQ